MKHQHVVVDYWTMLKTSCTCLLLALSGYILIKMVQTIFYLPGYLKNNQKRLEELAEKYNLDLGNEIVEAEIDKENNENKTKAALKNGTNDKDDEQAAEAKKLK